MDANVLRAISDETRMKIMAAIRHGVECPCAIPKSVGVSQPAVSQHLSVLLDAGLLDMKKKGVKHFYSLSPKGKKVLSDISKW